MNKVLSIEAFKLIKKKMLTVFFEETFFFENKKKLFLKIKTMKKKLVKSFKIFFLLLISAKLCFSL